MTVPATTIALDDPDFMIATLAASHDHLDRLTADLDHDAVTASTQLPGWTVAEVLSHLGSGAEIGGHIMGRALQGSGDTVDRDTMTGIWDRWNAMNPAQQHRSRHEYDARHLQILEGLDTSQRRTVRVPYFVGPLTVAEYAGYRLSEHAMHAWDVAVALDPEAIIEADTAAVLWARLALIAGRFHDAGVRRAIAPVDVALLPTDYAPASRLEIRPDGVALTPGESGSVQVRGPVEALVRLVYGRLDPNRRPHDHLDIRGELSLDTLTSFFPGY
ncbi:maleylpyruvate isomerase family mycothiol-dependent enzyme [Pseudonocardia sp. CA-142604]|uniref:maleylpyruvate isomerase family mycothiol-dependent enzyme n=1 Tax=Pseudonocardia sp. CA-142604 TaxID=3240024 RepID=UPI003D91C26A